LHAQICPPNIDFETGTFDNWTCYTGSVAAVGGGNIISLSPSGGPVADRHTMFTSTAGGALDPYGGFPVNCPNGSGHSIKLGNNMGGGEAEGISYEFTIPATENTYTLIYNYAVVFQDPNHQENEQPRMEIEVTNVTDNSVINCASFTFYPFGSPLPGFVLSANPGSSTPVWYKDWTAVSINLSGNAGKKIRLFFKSADCTFRRHFGYAYIDVNSECSGTFTGATYCPGDTVVNVTAPFGYQSYTWYNSSLTQVLGTQQILTLAPPPPTGTVVAVKVVPYNGYGCPQTLFAQFVDTLTVIARAGADTVSCNRSAVPLGSPPKPGLVYNWSPVAGLSNPHAANPWANPDTTTSYIVTTSNTGGGCVSRDTVVVTAAIINNNLTVLGKASYCIGMGDSAVLQVNPTDSIQWFRDGIALPGANSERFRATQSGLYHAVLYNTRGCSLATTKQLINIASIPEAGFNVPSTPNQCLVGNRFNFINISTNTVGTMQYTWVLGDGTVAASKDYAYSYLKAGIYDVKLIVNSSAVCADTSNFRVEVYQNAVADFAIKPVCVNLPVQALNITADTMLSPVSYRWEFGNGQVSSLRVPPAQVFTAPGTYVVSLSVNTTQCPLPLNTMKVALVVDRPRPGITYPVQYAVVDLPLPLQARQIGDSAFWSPGISLSTTSGFNPVFKGPSDQLYNINIKTATGCITTDMQQVKTVKQVEMYVPGAFTPNDDEKNDYLHPVLMGIKEIRYFRVYNRWGELVYESKTDRPGWDGTFRGVKQPTQTLVWMAEGLGVDGKIYTKKGTAVLLR